MARHLIGNSITLIVPVILAILVSCGGGNKMTAIIMAPDFQKGFIIDANIAVVILDEEPEIVYFGDAKKSLSASEIGKAMLAAASKDTTMRVEPETVVWEYFTDRFIKDILREIDVKSAFYSKVNHHFRITKEVVKTVDEIVTLEIPEVGTRLAFDDTSEVALVLFLDKIRLGTETDPYFLDRAEHGFTTSTGRRLLYLAGFTLWDNRELKPIAYGRVKTTLPITREEATIANWEEISRNFVRAMFEPTGFRKRNR